MHWTRDVSEKAGAPQKRSTVSTVFGQGLASHGVCLRRACNFRVSPGHSSCDLGGFCINAGLSIARWLFLVFTDKKEVLGLHSPLPSNLQRFLCLASWWISEAKAP